MLPMKPALAKATESDTLEEVGRATLQVVHDLKNQLNGLKLYATFLRKRLEQNDRAQEERETLSKLIAGITEQSFVKGGLDNRISVRLRKADTAPDEAFIEWLQENPLGSIISGRSLEGHANVHIALAAKIIKAHGGRIEFEPKRIRVW